MVKNTRGGKKCKKGKKTVNYDLEKIDESKGYYATINQRLGGRPARFLVKHNDSDLTSEVQIRNKLHKRLWINSGDEVFVNDGGEIVKVFKMQQEQEICNDIQDTDSDGDELTNKLRNSDDTNDSDCDTDTEQETNGSDDDDDENMPNILIKPQMIVNNNINPIIKSEINIDNI